MGEDQNCDTVDGQNITSQSQNGESYSRSLKMAEEKKLVIQHGASRKDVPRTIELTAKDLSYDIIYYVSELRKTKAPSRHASTLRRTVLEMSQKHAILYNGMIKKLQITKENATVVFENIANEIFRDGQYNWGRLVSVYAFGARIGKHLCETERIYVDKFAEFLGSYVFKVLGSWIHDQGGWDAFDEYFPEQKNVEDTIWKGLVVTALGLGALATMVVAAR